MELTLHHLQYLIRAQERQILLLPLALALWCCTQGLIFLLLREELRRL